MILKPASAKAVRYAIMNWHYSKAVPSVIKAFSVFNDAGDWCGVICYSQGANNNIASAFNLEKGNVIELVRIAMNGKQQNVSKPLAVSLKLIEKSCPLVDIVVSYADPEQGHEGIVYQAANWVFTGKSKPQREVIDPRTGKVMHKRTANSVFGTIKGLDKSKELFKLKYAYALTNRGKDILKGLALPYPKKAHEAKGDEAPTTSGEKGGAGPTRALNLPNK